MKIIKPHIFLVYCVINSVWKGESGLIDIGIYDLIKGFDVLWLSDSWLMVNNKHGSSEQISWTNWESEYSRKWNPGGNMGPIAYSNSIDKVVKYSVENGNFLNL